MRSMIRSFLLPLVAVAVVMLAGVTPAAAQTLCQTTVSTGDLASGDSITVTAPVGHTYLFSYTGAATGTISVTGTLNIVNGTGGVLHYVITDLNGVCYIPTMSESMLVLMALILAGLGMLFVRRRS